MGQSLFYTDALLRMEDKHAGQQVQRLQYKKSEMHVAHLVEEPFADGWHTMRCGAHDNQAYIQHCWHEKEAVTDGKKVPTGRLLQTPTQCNPDDHYGCPERPTGKSNMQHPQVDTAVTDIRVWLTFA
eukprot:GHUV01038411.1.p1 GENE.GHUV01038411.1~~GHUV01038411.1.p1  ORF type:complete len:127 (-),score=17.86 GHUV01038411.1:32-412(-)